MDIIESVTKLDVQSNSILVLRVAWDTPTGPLRVAFDKLSEWLQEQDLFNVQIFIVSGDVFNVDMITQKDMNTAGWFRKDDL